MKLKKKPLLLKRKLIKNGNILEILQILKIEPHPVEITLIKTQLIKHLNI